MQWISADFRQALRQFQIRDANTSFIYCDPPYLGTTNNYQQGFSEQDTIDLFEILVQSGIRFAVSEFDHPLVLELAKTHGLIVNDLGMRRNIGNRRRELLITNYQPVQQMKLI